MKVHGPNQTNFNPYKNNMQKQTEIKKEMHRADQLEISSEAKQLQESKKTNVKRAAYVQEIKNAVEAGEYKVNPEKTAEKMIAFWSRK